MSRNLAGVRRTEPRQEAKLLATAHAARRAPRRAQLSLPKTKPAAAGAAARAAMLLGILVLTCLSLSCGLDGVPLGAAKPPALVFLGCAGYLQAKLSGLHAAASEAAVLRASCRASRAGGSGERDGLPSGCPVRAVLS